MDPAEPVLCMSFIAINPAPLSCHVTMTSTFLWYFWTILWCGAIHCCNFTGENVHVYKIVCVSATQIYSNEDHFGKHLGLSHERLSSPQETAASVRLCLSIDHSLTQDNLLSFRFQCQIVPALQACQIRLQTIKSSSESQFIQARQALELTTYSKTFFLRILHSGTAKHSS